MFPLQSDLGLSTAIAQHADSLTVRDHISGHIEYLKNTAPEEVLQNMIHHGIDFGLKILAAFAIYFIGMWIAKLIKKAVTRSMTRRKTDKSVQSFTLSLISVLSTVLVIVLSVSALGINTTSVAALLAALGMALGMALSGAMGNFAGGILILMFKPFRAGDYISAQGYEGSVNSISIFNTKIITPDNKVITIPNGVLSNGPITNFSHYTVRRINLEIGVAYGTSVEHMRDICTQIMKNDSRVLTSSTEGAEDPFVSVKELSDSVVIFNVRCWVKTENYWPVYHDLNNAIYTTLPEKGINFAFPQVDVHMK